MKLVHFVPWDVLSLGMFCPSDVYSPSGHFVPRDVLSLRKFCPWDILSLGRFVCWDVLSLGPYVSGRFILGRFVPWDVLSLGKFCPGTFCLCAHHEIVHVVSHFPPYISCYTAESRYSLGQCGAKQVVRQGIQSVPQTAATGHLCLFFRIYPSSMGPSRKIFIR